jgi:hypothetical protein
MDEILKGAESDLGPLNGVSEEDVVVWVANEVRATLKSLLLETSWEQCRAYAMELVALRSICIDGLLTEQVIRELAIEVSR